VKERPIRFSAPMVRAILAGTKTQDRRIVKPQPAYETISQDVRWYRWRGQGMTDPEGIKKCLPPNCPYGQSGDRLWVRETTIIAPKRWSDGADGTHTDKDGDPRIVQYLASSPNREAANDYGLKATPSIFMPRWASRITLEVTGVRVERLREISASDAWAEGVPHSPDVDPVHEYQDIWESINGADSWDSNPWVWVVEFAYLKGDV